MKHSSKVDSSMLPVFEKSKSKKKEERKTDNQLELKHTKTSLKRYQSTNKSVVRGDSESPEDKIKIKKIISPIADGDETSEVTESKSAKSVRSSGDYASKYRMKLNGDEAPQNKTMRDLTVSSKSKDVADHKSSERRRTIQEDATDKPLMKYSPTKSGMRQKAENSSDKQKDILAAKKRKSVSVTVTDVS